MDFKEHIKKYKVVYICVSVSAVAGITYLIVKEPRAILRGGMDDPIREFTGSFFSANALFQKVDNSAVTTIHTGSKGNPGFVTRCIETGELFTTQGAAARTYNIPEPYISAHLNKGFELQEGLHFERLGVFSN